MNKIQKVNLSHKPSTVLGAPTYFFHIEFSLERILVVWENGMHRISYDIVHISKYEHKQCDHVRSMWDKTPFS